MFYLNTVYFILYLNIVFWIVLFELFSGGIHIRYHAYDFVLLLVTIVRRYYCERIIICSV